MPRAFICDRPSCGAIITDITKIMGVEGYRYSTGKGSPRRQTTDIYLCDDCAALLDRWVAGTDG